MTTLSGNTEKFFLRIVGVSSSLKVVRFTGQERLSQLYAYTVELVSENAELDLAKVAGAEAVLTLCGEGDEVERYIHGRISRFKQAEDGRRLTTYHAELVPALAWAKQRQNCRIFQGRSVPEIVELILKQNDFSTDDYRLALTHPHALREYCVQYRETDYGFIARLLAEEGMFYFFEHTQKQCRLMIVDSATAPQNIGDPHTLAYHPATGTRPADDSVSEFNLAHGVRSGAVALRDFNFKKPALNLQEGAQASQDAALEIFDYPGRYDTPELGAQRATVRLEALQVARIQASGATDCLRLVSGFRFALTKHPRNHFNRDYLLTEVASEGAQPQVLEEGARGEGSKYANRFTAIPADVPFRSEYPAHKPGMQGVQTAMVVGPPGEEIYVDEYGRVKVQFHWDREGKRDDKSSCWIRVSQLWAGAAWGAMFIPRVGHEVIVEFIDGDPDRPIITGSVYHGTNRPPYQLPEGKNKSALRSNSTPGGNAANEIRFDDSKDAEQLFLHAQRDMDVHVTHNRRETVGNDHHEVVERDRIARVERDAHCRVERDTVTEVLRDCSLKVGGKHMIEVTGSHSITVHGDVHAAYNANRSEETRGDLHFKASSVVIEGMADITLKVGGNFVKIDGSGVTVVGTVVKINSGGSAGNVRPANAVPARTPLPAMLAATLNGGGAANGAGAQNKNGDTRPTHKEPQPNDEVPADKTWIEIEAIDKNDLPVPGAKYEIELPDGKIASGTTGPDGVARIEGVQPGSCKIRFPELDKDTWEKA